MRKVKCFLIVVCCLLLQVVYGQNISTADEIIKLKKLYDQGILTKDEFDTQKAKLLGTSYNNNSSNTKKSESKSTESINDITLPEAEFAGGAVFVKSNSEGVPLESTHMALKTKSSTGIKLIGLGKVRQSATVAGKHSAVILPSKNVLRFIYTCSDNNENPNNVIQLYHFQIKENDREVEIGSRDAWGQTTQGAENFVSFSAKKYGSNSYLIEVKNMQPGEYGFTYSKGEVKATSIMINTFAIE